MRPHQALLLTLTAILPGCATIFDGTQQNLAVVTEPAGALCAVDRAGTLLGTVDQTPGIVHLERSKETVSISCVKDGYKAVVAVLPSRFTGVTFANFGLFPSVIGVAAFLVDASNGANWAYSPSVTLRMSPGRSLPAARILPLDSYGNPAS